MYNVFNLPYATHSTPAILRHSHNAHEPSAQCWLQYDVWRRHLPAGAPHCQPLSEASSPNTGSEKFQDKNYTNLHKSHGFRKFATKELNEYNVKEKG
jgi:hypothetical protein